MKLPYIILMAVCLVSGCTTYRAIITDGNSVAKVEMTYFLQDKAIKRFSFDPNTKKITIENFGSETSQVVESAIGAALGGVR